jgi:hypothetical protein
MNWFYTHKRGKSLTPFCFQFSYHYLSASGRYDNVFLGFNEPSFALCSNFFREGAGWEPFVLSPRLLLFGLRAVSLFILHKDRKCCMLSERLFARTGQFDDISKRHFAVLKIVRGTRSSQEIHAQ